MEKPSRNGQVPPAFRLLNSAKGIPISSGFNSEQAAGLGRLLCTLQSGWWVFPHSGWNGEGSDPARPSSRHCGFTGLCQTGGPLHPG